MKSAATYAGDPRHHASDIERLREQNKRLRAEAQEDYRAARRAEAALDACHAELAALKIGVKP